jgi:hypothetical protein
MSHGPEHHIEHAEHASHAAHDPFDKRVTLSIAIVAAVLAAVTMLSHRAHNATLQLHSEATRLQAEAGIVHNQAANQWAYFQSWNIREHAYRTDLEQLKLFAPAPDSAREREAAQKRWAGQVAKYEKGLPEMEAKARKLTEQGEELQEASKQKLEEADHIHHVGDRYDVAELGVEFGMVLCALAVLTKKRGFWYSGVACSLVGVAVAAFGLYQQFIVLPYH